MSSIFARRRSSASVKKLTPADLEAAAPQLGSGSGLPSAPVEQTLDSPQAPAVGSAPVEEAPPERESAGQSVDSFPGGFSVSGLSINKPEWDDDKVWQECITPKNEVYYWNKLTNETTWIKPHSVDGAPAQKLKLGLKIARKRAKDQLPSEIPPAPEKKSLMQVVQEATDSEAPVVANRASINEVLHTEDKPLAPPVNPLASRVLQFEKQEEGFDITTWEWKQKKWKQRPRGKGPEREVRGHSVLSLHPASPVV